MDANGKPLYESVVKRSSRQMRIPINVVSLGNHLYKQPAKNDHVIPLKKKGGKTMRRTRRRTKRRTRRKASRKIIYK
jgi:hypothetical protein